MSPSLLPDGVARTRDRWPDPRRLRRAPGSSARPNTSRGRLPRARADGEPDRTPRSAMRRAGWSVSCPFLPENRACPMETGFRRPFADGECGCGLFFRVAFQIAQHENGAMFRGHAAEDIGDVD